MTFMAACIAGLLLFGVGGTGFLPSAHDTVIKVNGAKLSQAQFDRFYFQLSRRSDPNTPQDRAQMNQQALQELIRQEVFYQEAKKYGLDTTDQELQMELASIPNFQKEGRFDGATYVQAIRQMFGMSPHEFEKGHKKDLVGRKLNQLIMTTVHISDSSLKEAMDIEERKAQEILNQAIKSGVKKDIDQAKENLAKFKELKTNPEKFKESLTTHEVNLVFNDYLNQLNNTLKVNIVSDRFQQRLSGSAS